MTDRQDPVRQLFEVAVYAPIGLMLLARREMPALTAAGKSRVESQITLAKFIGKMALTRGSQELKRRLDAAEAARTGAPIVVDAASTEIAMPSPDDVVTLPDTIIAAVVEAETEREAAEPAPSGALPIDGYDSLAASQVVVRLATLTSDELAIIQAHEANHRNRRTILGKITQLQAR
ncbi:MAG: hypothetical protein ABIR32_04180 [Ilumatobacteraceae bacterium]